MINGALYQTTATDIKKNILAGNYEVGALIPTENQLEKMYGVSKITIRKAVELLVAEGYLQKKSGIGTKVISNNLFNKLSKAKSYASIVNEHGTLTKTILKIKLVSPTATPFEASDQKVLYIKRLYTLNGQPFIIFEHYLPNIAIQSELKELRHRSLYKILKDSGQEINHFKDTFKAVRLDAADQKVLQSANGLAMKRQRQGFDRAGNLIEFSIAVYDTNKFPYEIDYEV
ncbi:GntR family transcriptional regulator [Lactiplantibacillus sp. WILCCON 0030]|uniref:GntR family transcriptional regulator n=1 Tax=Lactiplantibacillus brownii TaxID=3069269 RepID=A0ABU1ABL9_9LACO|nr:GntR family transcriptional regulator [Lactiplantibacillus brownii]MDQ7938364.1 GntR family transcriptional regulator [Lactiplantibacillus brownii]